MFIEDMMSEDAKIIYRVLNMNTDVYVVGGSIRDMFINNIHGTSHCINDWDFSVSCSSSDVVNLFNGRLKVNKCGAIRSVKCSARVVIPKHGTVKVNMFGDGYEISPFKGDDIYADLLERDFTINAMAYNFETGLIDRFVDGFGNEIKPIRDIEMGVIKSIRDPMQSFEKDPYRILRGLYFSYKYDFDISKLDLDAMKRLKCRITEISDGRLRNFFNRFLDVVPTSSYRFLKEVDIFSIVCPYWGEADYDELYELLKQCNDIAFEEKTKFLKENFSDKDKMIMLIEFFV